MELEILSPELSVCRVEDYSLTDITAPFTFLGCTDEEKSLVCQTALVPGNALSREDGWRAFRIAGTLDFSLVGILARITGLLADAGIGLFAVSTYNTDYVLVKAEHFDRALDVLRKAGYSVK